MVFSMFIFTAKFSRKKAVAAIIVLAVILCAVILIAGSFSDQQEAGTFTAVVKNNEERCSYLQSLGWDVSEDPIEEQTVVIPQEMSGVYGEYSQLQSSQGFDLSNYKGLEATRYTYQVYNHPESSDNVVADIIVYRNQVIAGDIKSTSIDGFMDGLEFPES